LNHQQGNSPSKVKGLIIMAKRIESNSTVLVLSQEEAAALRGVLYQLADVDEARKVTINGDHELVATLWASLFGSAPIEA
jgi:hypothetical protein